MLLTDAAFKCLTTYQHNMVDKDAKSSLYEIHDMTVRKSGDLFLYKGQRISFVLIPPIPDVRQGSIEISFYKEGPSNFTGIRAPSPKPYLGGISWKEPLTQEDPARTFAPCVVNGQQINFFNGEMMFKAACAVSQMDHGFNADPAKTQVQLDTLDAVLSAATPLQCKNATRKLPLDRQRWDEESLDIMVQVQYWKCMDPHFHAIMLYIGYQAEEFGIPMDRCYWYEAARDLKEDGTEKHNDLIWGCGHTTDEMHAMVVADPEGFKANLPGKNGLGVALRLAFLRVVGNQGEFLRTSVHDYIERIGTESTIFCYCPRSDSKRPRTDSFTRTTTAGSPEPGSPNALTRTGSDTLCARTGSGSPEPGLLCARTGSHLAH